MFFDSDGSAGLGGAETRLENSLSAGVFYDPPSCLLAFFQLQKVLFLKLLIIAAILLKAATQAFLYLYRYANTFVMLKRPGESAVADHEHPVDGAGRIRIT